ncbi:hypothetical protein CSUB01_11413 [Colletotrichum sublineola]|uniref:Ubiquitin-like protease family profile domain-containing protein n=1 Tax=Colletotrichum sublineola TaxID=1173701 RepID=A0A066XTC4_COLSU|nr:hypothetical protein CSUB01_11413 [Colletotrichum sublineola]
MLAECQLIVSIEEVLEFQDIDAKRLEDEFAHDPTHAGADFRTWAFDNVVLAILNLVNDQIFSETIQALRTNVSRRWNTALRHHNISLGTLAFFFGDNIVASRPCAESTSALCKSHAANSIIELYRIYRSQSLLTRQVNQRTAVRHFRQAIQSISERAWPLKHRQKKEKRATTASDDASNSDTDKHTDVESRFPSRDSESPDRGRRSPSLGLSSPAVSPISGIQHQADFAPRDSETPPPFTNVEVSNELDGGNTLLDVTGTPLSPQPTEDDLPQTLRWEDDGGDNPNGSDHNLSTILEAPLEDESTALAHRAVNRQKLTAVINGHDDHASSEATPQCAHLHLDNGSPFQFDFVTLPGSVNSRPQYKHKRSLSEAGIFAAPPTHESLKRPAKLPRVSVVPAAPEAARSSSRISTQQVNLQDVLQSAHRLGQGTWLNDIVMQTISRRLKSTTVGIVHSLTIAAKQMTERGRLQLQTTMAKSKVLLFLNHNENHWVLFLWEPIRNLLTEFNSLSTVSLTTSSTNLSNALSASPSTALPADAPSQIVSTFLRWATNDASLQVALRKAECPQQPNGFNCGVYALAFAEKVAENKEIPPTLDGNLERVCLGGAALTSWNCVPRPEELVLLGPHIPRTTVERAARVKLLRHRQASFRALMKSYEGQPSQTSVTSSHKGQIHSLTESECRDCRQSTLAGIMLSEMTEHRRALESALSSQNSANMLDMVQPLDAALREQVKGFIAAMQARDAVRPAEEAVGTAMLGKQAKDRKRENCQAMYINAGLALESWDESAESDAQKRHLAREAARDGYVRSCVHMLILRYITAKFRQGNGTT